MATAAALASVPAKDVRDMTTDELTPDLNFNSLLMSDLKDHIAALGGDPIPSDMSKADIIATLKLRLTLREVERQRSKQLQMAVGGILRPSVDGFDPAPPPRVTSRIPSTENHDLPNYSNIPGSTPGYHPSHITQSPPSTLEHASTPAQLPSAPVPTNIMPQPTPGVGTPKPKPYTPTSNGASPEVHRSTGSGKGKAVSTDYQPPLTSQPTVMGPPQPGGKIDMVVSPNAPEVIRRFLYPAENGDSYSQMQLGKAFLNGTGGVDQDVNVAYEWFMRAANEGYAEAQVQVGVIIQDGMLKPNGAGDVSEEDLRVAADMYQRAADQGDVDGMTKLG
ncbi:hypothetical protein HDU67_005663, partial [Dinochytrium kinnereticum]